MKNLKKAAIPVLVFVLFVFAAFLRAVRKYDTLIILSAQEIVIFYIYVIKCTMSGENIYPEGTPVLNIGLAQSIEFTPREMEVLREIVNGSTYKEISEVLGMSENTLKTHIKHLLSKSGYKSTLKLAVDVVNKKLVLPGF